jgi:hypothetical protein
MRNGKSSGDNVREPVLDKGIAITGDLVVKLMGMKLLPIKVRLLVSSTKLATDLGLDWWREESANGSSAGRQRRTKKKKKSTGRGREITRQDGGPNGGRKEQ